MLTPLNGIIPSYGAVIDARGLNSGNTSMTCTSSQPSPWSGITSPPPSTIFMPAGVITIPSTWAVPSGTHLIGMGDSVYSGVNTTIVAVSGFSSGTAMIQFGSASGASGISVERLTLDGAGASITGILNQYAGDDSSVDHVSLYQILGKGLLVENSANNSGPYSNISFDTGNETPAPSTVCAQILDVTNGSVSGSTRGIHSLRCHTANSDPNAAVLLDSSNNSIEDVTIRGFYDGVRVGANGTAQDNVLVNIVGDTTNASLTPVNTVHIYAPTGSIKVSDLSIMGVTNSGLPGTYTIEDALTSPHLSDSYIALYAIGNEGTGSYYSRFTTSPNAATWAVGPSAPSGSCPQGSLYSCIGSSSGSGSNCIYASTYYALWACAYNGGSLSWLPVL